MFGSLEAQGQLSWNGDAANEAIEAGRCPRETGALVTSRYAVTAMHRPLTACRIL